MMVGYASEHLFGHTASFSFLQLIKASGKDVKVIRALL